jgi:hypothetical protein
MFTHLDKAASMAQLMSIVKHQKAVSAKLNGCSGVCVVGATAGLSVRKETGTLIALAHRCVRDLLWCKATIAIKLTISRGLLNRRTRTRSGRGELCSQIALPNCPLHRRLELAVHRCQIVGANIQLDPGLCVVNPAGMFNARAHIDCTHSRMHAFHGT